MAEHLGTRHHIVKCDYEDIRLAFPDVIWHTETPILRTAPIPMYLLSRLVHSDGLKVVVTGEGADEFLAGYDIFKEMVVRRFWARVPESSLRPLLLQKLYPDIQRLNRSKQDYLTAFFQRGLTDTGNPYYSHSIRWNNTRRLVRFLAQPPGATSNLIDCLNPLPSTFQNWSALGQAQYIEVMTFLSPYLLSSQGDRVSMANSVEGRFPFLDYRLVEFCNRLPSHLKMNGLVEKFLLRKLAAPLLPEEISKRVKRPYRAPIHRSFFQPHPVGYVQEMLSPETVKKVGLFQPEMVSRLVQKAESGNDLTEVEDMGLVGILSTQILHKHFIESPAAPSPFPVNKPFKVVNLCQERN
jgi:asparagine synthase (glutamine-hydrolysing)